MGAAHIGRFSDDTFVEEITKQTLEGLVDSGGKEGVDLAT